MASAIDYYSGNVFLINTMQLKINTTFTTKKIDIVSRDNFASSLLSVRLRVTNLLLKPICELFSGATNRIDAIDPALRRPGRFDREFAFPPPDKKVFAQYLDGRKSIE